MSTSSLDPTYSVQLALFGGADLQEAFGLRRVTVLHYESVHAAAAGVLRLQAATHPRVPRTRAPGRPTPSVTQ